MSDGFRFQVSTKPGEKPMINIRGESPGDFDANLDWVKANAGKINEVVALLGGDAPTPTGLSVIQRELGGQVVAEYDTPPPSQPSQGMYSPPTAYQQPPMPMAYPAAWPPAEQGPPPGWAVSQQPASTHCARCKRVPACETCGQTANPIPKSIKDGAYFLHECPSGNRDHKTIWCNTPK